jgi:NAD(P)-dependent dehydrogenase (short-subunit alcohol dehydrogenase family)
MRKLEGKTAIVTGGAGGIGRVFALHLADLGASVAILDKDLSIARKRGETLTADTVEAEIKSRGVRAMAIECDLTDRKAAERAIGHVADTLGGLDILVNNAGGAFTPFERSSGVNSPIEDTNALFDVNFFATVHCCQAAAVHLQKRRGVILNMATMGVFADLQGGGVALYSAAKAAVHRYTRSLAVELGPVGVRANCMAPGYINTARVKAAAAQRKVGTPDRTHLIPLGRAGEPEDLTGTLEYLVTDQSAYVTGECIMVTGGTTLVMPS